MNYFSKLFIEPWTKVSLTMPRTASKLIPMSLVFEALNFEPVPVLTNT